MPEVKASLFTADGTAKGEVDLDPAIFGIEPNLPVLHQVVTAQLAAMRSGTASTKTRGEVRGGGRKPWRQKGLGRARHGSTRAPQWTGGGVVFGPHPRDFSQRTPKKMRRLALLSALSTRAAEEAVKVVEDFATWERPRTKNATALLKAIGAGSKSVVVLDREDEVAERSFRNLPGVRLVRSGQLSAHHVIWGEILVFTQTSLGSVGGGEYAVSDTDFVREGKPVEPAEDGDEE